MSFDPEIISSDICIYVRDNSVVSSSSFELSAENADDWDYYSYSVLQVPLLQFNISLQGRRNEGGSRIGAPT